MRFLIETITGRKGYKSFETPEEYINFMAEKGHLVKELKEADLPYTDKPVKLPKISSSKGWSEVSDFGEVGEEAEKGESLIASTSKSVMKDEANMEMSKSSEKADKPEMGLGAEKGDVDMSDFKSFEYEEPKLKSSETKSEKSSSEEPKEESSEKKEESKDVSKEEKSSNDKDAEEKSSDDKEDKDDSKKHDKDIDECLKAAGIQLEEGIKDYLPRAGFIRDNDEDKDSSKMGIWGGQGTDEQLRKAKIIAKVKFANGDRMGRVTKEDLDNFDEFKAQYDEIYGSDELDEGWKDKLKKGAATLGVAGALAGNAMAHDPMYDGARNPNTEDTEVAYSQTVKEEPQIKKILPNGMIVDQFGNEWSKKDFDKLIAGENPFADGARNPDTEDVDESFDEEIAECLRAAGC